MTRGRGQGRALRRALRRALCRALGRSAGVLTAALPLALGVAVAPASAAEEPTIEAIEVGEDALHVLVTLPPGTDPEAGDVTATLDGLSAEASASPAQDTIRRTAVLAIDTSISMDDDNRLAAAQEAATRFISSIPAEVHIAVVTFDAEPRVALEPSLDHAAAIAAVSDLVTAPDTALYAAVGSALDLAGSDGARQILLVSDGEDSMGGDLAATTALLGERGVRLDAIALDADSDVAALGELAAASGGSVVEASADDLGGVLDDEATAISNQVVVDVSVPAGIDGATARLEIALGAGASASAVAPIGDLSAKAVVPDETAASPAATAGAGSSSALPAWSLYVGIGIFALGLLAAITLAIPRRAPLSPADRVTSYTAAVSAQSAGAHRIWDEPQDRGEDPFATTKAAANQVLEHNKGLETRISTRLEGAGSAWKPAEWLLVHVAVFVGFGILGLLVGGGNLIVGVAFLALGALLPWVWLGVRRSRRRRAFDAALPDTLQLMAGAMSAGLSLTQACDTIARDGQEPVASEFRRILVETRLGVSVDDAMADAADRFDSSDFRWVVMAIRIQREVGGNLAELLTTVAATMREREYLRRQVKALSAEGRLSAYILAGLPPGFLVFQLISNPDYIMPLFTDPRGWVILGGGVLLLAIGSFWMSRMVKVEI